MGTPTPPAAAPGGRRGRTRKVESFSDWMARMDGQVEAMARKMCSRPPADRLLTSPQRRIVEMLVEHLRNLPPLQSGQDPFRNRAYHRIRTILTNLFRAKHRGSMPARDGTYYIDSIPEGDSTTYYWLFRNCAGRDPEEMTAASEEED